MAMVDRFLYQNAEIAVWKIEESEAFYTKATGLVSLIKSDKRRLEYYAGRFVLQHLIPHLNFENIKVSLIGKPYLADQSFRFSISHSYPYVAVAVHSDSEVGIDIQVFRDKIERLQPKFLNESEMNLQMESIAAITLLWNAKEAMFKWRGTGGQDFSEQLNILQVQAQDANKYSLQCRVVDHNLTQHPLLLLGKIEAEYALAIAVGDISASE